MSSFTKGEGAKIAIKFTMPLTGDVRGYTPEPFDWRLGDDLAQGKPASAGSVRHATTYAADLAFDGDRDTQWEPAFRNLTWLKVDLEAEETIRGMHYRRAAGGFAWRFDVHASNDDVNWDLIYQTPENTPTDYEIHEIDFGDNYTYRYWRITVTTRNGNYPGFSIVQYNEAEPVGNDRAFTITALEPRWTEIPSLVLGELIDGGYEVRYVEAHPTEPNTILLTCYPLERFANVEGNITINYNSVLGNLTGLGGIVESFEETFTPDDLERLINPYWIESLAGEILVEVDFNRIYHQLIGDGEYPTDDNRSIKPVREYEEGPPEVTEQLKGKWGENDGESLRGTLSVSVNLIHTDDLDP